MTESGCLAHGRDGCDECFLEATLEDTITLEAANDAKVIGALTSALHQAQTERDRYRDALEAIRSWCPNQPTGHAADDAFSRIIAKVRIALDGMSREDWNDIANGRD